jgi:hypothetical protein
LAAVGCLAAAVPAHATLVAYWPYDGDSLDHSANTNNATLHNGAGYGGGLYGQALLLDGADDHATVPDHPTLRIGPYAVSAWVRPAQDNEHWTGIVGKPGRNFNMWMGDSNKTYGGYIHHRWHDGAGGNSGISSSGTGTVPLNTWSNILLWNDGTQGRTYINGALTSWQNVSGTLITDNTTLYMGRSLDGGNSGYYEGTIDDVAIWDGPLAKHQVQDLLVGNAPTTLSGTPPPAPTTPVLGYWKLDDPLGRVAFDSSGRANVGGVLGQSTSVPGVSGGAFQFTDGQTDRIQLFEPVDLDTDWTIAGWFKNLMPSGAWRTLTRGMSNDHQIIVENSSQRLGVYDNSGGGAFRPALDANGLPVDMTAIYNDPTTWYHIAAVGHDGVTDFYIGGAYVGTADRQSTADVWAIGNIQGGTQKFANYLDDLAIFDIKLTGQQIRGLAAGGSPLRLVPEPTTLLIWSLLAGLGIGVGWRRRTR